MRRLMEQSLDWPDPMYIRLAKGGDPIVSDPARGFTIGKGILIREPGTVLFVTTGVMLGQAMQAADLLAKSGRALRPCSHAYDQAARYRIVERSCGRSVRWWSPSRRASARADLAARSLKRCRRVLAGDMPRVLRIGLPDAFPHEYGSQDTMFDTFGLKGPQIAKTVSNELASNSRGRPNVLVSAEDRR